MSALSETIVAGTAMATALGGAVGWLWREIKREGRERKIEIDELRKELHQCEHGRERHRTVIELLWQELNRFAADSPVLTRAKHLLDQLKDGVP